MAQKVIVSLVDDLTGGEAAETVTFGLDGNTYEVDLSTENASKLRESLAQFVGVARKASRGAGRGTRGSNSGQPGESAKARAWAVENGHDVPARGRVPQAVVEAYRAAQSATPEPVTEAVEDKPAKSRKPRAAKQAKVQALEVEPA